MGSKLPESRGDDSLSNSFAQSPDPFFQSYSVNGKALLGSDLKKAAGLSKFAQARGSRSEKKRGAGGREGGAQAYED